MNTFNERNKVTIIDIAKACGLSSATVSRVLSGKDSVKKEKNDVVMKYVNELGYQYQPKKKLLKAVNDRKIVIIVDDIANPFYISIMQGAICGLENGNYMITIIQTDNATSLEEVVGFAQLDNYAGIIMITAVETKGLIRLLKKNVCPVVLANRDIFSLDLNSVCTDNFGGGYKATKYLIDNGHKKIAHLAGPKNSTASSNQRRGYIMALQNEGIPVNNNAIFFGDLKSESGTKFAKYFMSHLCGYTAVYCANELMAVALVQELEKHGYRIPDDVSIICFDDTDVALSGAIKFTTISSSGNTMGQVAAEIMNTILRSNNNLRRKVVFPPVLNERNSVRNLLHD